MDAYIFAGQNVDRGPQRVDSQLEEYRAAYSIAPEHDRADSLRVAAKIEVALRAFLVEGGFGAFTDNFQDLFGLDQLPGIATQRLMAEGYGFGGEGDWKTAALVRTMKVMAHGMPGGTSTKSTSSSRSRSSKNCLSPLLSGCRSPA